MGERQGQFYIYILVRTTHLPSRGFQSVRHMEPSILRHGRSLNWVTRKKSPHCLCAEGLRNSPERSVIKAELLVFYNGVNGVNKDASLQYVRMSALWKKKSLVAP